MRETSPSTARSYGLGKEKGTLDTLGHDYGRWYRVAAPGIVHTTARHEAAAAHEITDNAYVRAYWLGYLRAIREV